MPATTTTTTTADRRTDSLTGSRVAFFVNKISGSNERTNRPAGRQLLLVLNEYTRLKIKKSAGNRSLDRSRSRSISSAIRAAAALGARSAAVRFGSSGWRCARANCLVSSLRMYRAQQKSSKYDILIFLRSCR